jgi:hypothetical protein
MTRKLIALLLLGCLPATAQNSQLPVHHPDNPIFIPRRHAPYILPARLSECESQVCGTWTLSGKTGRAQWPSGAVAALQVERYDFDGITIRRTDDAGQTRGLTAIYTGKVEGNHIDGKVTWTWPGHWDKSPSSTWFAIIVQPANYTVLDARVPCDAQFHGSAAEAAARGAQALDANNLKPAACWLRIGADGGDTDAEGTLAAMLYHGLGVPSSYEQALPLARKAATQNNYLADRCLSLMYGKGQGVPKDPEQEQFWNAKADRDKAAALLAEQQRREIDRQQAQRIQAQQTQLARQFNWNVGAVLVLGALFAAMASDSGGSAGGDENGIDGFSYRKYQENKQDCAQGYGMGCN